MQLNEGRASLSPSRPSMALGHSELVYRPTFEADLTLTQQATHHLCTQVLRMPVQPPPFTSEPLFV